MNDDEKGPGGRSRVGEDTKKNARRHVSYNIDYVTKKKYLTTGREHCPSVMQPNDPNDTRLIACRCLSPGGDAMTRGGLDEGEGSR